MTDTTTVAPTEKAQRLTLKDAVALSIVLTTADVQVEDLMATADCTRSTATDYLRRAEKVARVLLGRRALSNDTLNGDPTPHAGASAVQSQS